MASTIPAQTAAIQAAIERAIETSLRRGTDPGARIAIGRPSLKRHYALLVSPLRPEAVFLSMGQPAAAVMVSDPELSPQTDFDLLQHTFGLTRKEEALVCQLLEGKGLETAAEELHMQYGTARTHLRRIFAKTGVRRQGELIRLGLSLPALPKVP